MNALAKRRGRWVVWSIGVLVVGAPGLLLLQLAIVDAGKTGSSWIPIAIPFLSASAICMVLAGRAHGGRGALIGAALALVLAVSSFLRVHRANAIVAEQRVSSTAIADLGRLCEREQPEPAANATQMSRALPVYEVDHQGHARVAIEAAYKDWAPSQAADASLVACLRFTRTKIETCNYEAGAIAVRNRPSRIITIVDVKTGAVIAMSKLTGDMPAACGDHERFVDDGAGGGFKEILGNAPTASQVADTLRPFVDR